MAFQVFISYARADDTIPVGVSGAIGFVTLLDKNLEQKFISLGKPTVKGWRDTAAIESGEQFERKIQDGIDASQMLVVVLTAAWLDSAYCRRELDLFVQKFARDPENIRDRIIVVLRTWIDPGQWPEPLRGQGGYRFYESENNRDGAPERPFYTSAGRAQDQFFDVIESTAKLVHARAKAQEGEPVPDTTTAANSRIIYVAQAADDMRSEYQMLVAELRDEGYRVVPDPASKIPTDKSAVAFVSEALRDAEVSVHLLGQSLGYAPDRAKHLVSLQLERAATRAQAAVDSVRKSDRGFRRIIFAPTVFVDPDDDENSVPTRNPIAVRDGFDGAVETDKVDGSGIRDFIINLKQHLKATAPPPKMRPGTVAPGSRVFLDFDPMDWEYVADVATALDSRGVAHEYAAFEDSQLKNELTNKQRLKRCTAVVLCWAKTSDAWLTSRAQMLDWQDLGRREPFACRAAVAGKPERISKTLYSRSPPGSIELVLDLTAYEKPPPEAFDPFIKEIGEAHP